MAQQINVVHIVIVGETVDKDPVVEGSLWLGCDAEGFLFFHVAGVDQSVVVLTEKSRLKDEFLDFVSVPKNVVAFIPALVAELGDLHPRFLDGLFGQLLV